MSDGSFQLDRTAMSTTADLALGQCGEPALDLVEPRGGGWREVHVEAGIAHSHGHPLANFHIENFRIDRTIWKREWLIA
jgi:hypothetical protein